MKENYEDIEEIENRTIRRLRPLDSTYEEAKSRIAEIDRCVTVSLVFVILLTSIFIVLGCKGCQQDEDTIPNPARSNQFNS